MHSLAEDEADISEDHIESIRQIKSARLKILDAALIVFVDSHIRDLVAHHAYNLAS